MYKAKTSIWDMEYTDNYEKVCSYIDKTKSKITKIKKCYNEVKDVLKKFIEISHNYSVQMSSIALKLFPNSDSVEGKLIQAIQGILLFNSEAIDNLVKEVQEILNNFKASRESNSSGLDDLSKIYQTNYSDVLKLYCNFVSENELYEKYLIHKELGISLNKNQFENKINKNKIGNNTDDKFENKNQKKEYSSEPLNKDKGDSEKEKIKEKIKSNDLNKKKSVKEEKIKSKEKPKLSRKDIIRLEEKEIKRYQEIKEKEKEREKEKDTIKEVKEEILTDNHEKIKISQKEYIDTVKRTNIFIKKLVEFGWNEERLLKSDFYNNCHNFVIRLLNCVDVQKKKYENQSKLIRELSEIIKSEKIENFYLESQQYTLHSLSIYMNKKSKKNSYELKQKGEFDNELYKNLEINNIGNIINEMQKNSLTVKKEDLDNYEKEKNISVIEKNIKFISESSTDLSEEEKNKIIEFFKNDKEYILYFLQRLNNDRAKGGKILNVKTYHRIGELFKFINDIILEKNDYECFKYISILSMTYYKMEGNNKIYIYEYIKEHPYFKKCEFWQEYLEALIDFDVRNAIYKKRKNTDENKTEKKKEEESKKNFAAFSNVLTVANNMTDFGLEKPFVEKFLNKVKNRYTFNSEQIEQIDFLLTIYEEKNKEEKKTNSPKSNNENKEHSDDKIKTKCGLEVENKDNTTDKLNEDKNNETISKKTNNSDEIIELDKTKLENDKNGIKDNKIFDKKEENNEEIKNKIN